MKLEEIEKNSKRFYVEDYGIALMSISEIEQLFTKLHRLKDAIEKHRDNPVIYYRDCTSVLQEDHYSADEELYKSLENL